MAERQPNKIQCPELSDKARSCGKALDAGRVILVLSMFHRLQHKAFHGRAVSLSLWGISSSSPSPRRKTCPEWGPWRGGESRAGVWACRSPRCPRGEGLLLSLLLLEGGGNCKRWGLG